MSHESGSRGIGSRAVVGLSALSLLSVGFVAHNALNDVTLETERAARIEIAGRMAGCTIQGVTSGGLAKDSYDGPREQLFIDVATSFDYGDALPLMSKFDHGKPHANRVIWKEYTPAAKIIGGYTVKIPFAPSGVDDGRSVVETRLAHGSKMADAATATVPNELSVTPKVDYAPGTRMTVALRTAVETTDKAPKIAPPIVSHYQRTDTIHTATAVTQCGVIVRGHDLLDGNAVWIPDTAADTDAETVVSETTRKQAYTCVKRELFDDCTAIY